MNSSLIEKVSKKLNPEEKDALKYQLSLNAVQLLENKFNVSRNKVKRDLFYFYLQSLIDIHPCKKRLKNYGISYKGFPEFITKEVLLDLQKEAQWYRKKARKNFEQFLSSVNTPDASSIAERLEMSNDVFAFVKKHAGNCKPSFVTSYIYYDNKGNCSVPHVDNDFTSITMMIGIRANSKKSKSIIYWPNKKTYKYTLREGEAVIFYGTSILHGRTGIEQGDEVQSLLLSFKLL